MQRTTIVCGAALELARKRIAFNGLVCSAVGECVVQLFCEYVGWRRKRHTNKMNTFRTYLKLALLVLLQLNSNRVGGEEQPLSQSTDRNPPILPIGSISASGL